MLTQDELRNVIGSDAYDSNGDKIGKVGQVFLDDQTGEPEWATVNTGFFSMNESFVPIANAVFEGDRLRLPVLKSQVKDAPSVSPEGGHLSQEEERNLYDYYGMSYSESRSDSGLPGDGAPTAAGTTGTETRTTDDAMTRSEERLDVGKVQEETGRARLRKYVVTEDVNVPVTTTRERARVETEPITDANVGQAMDGPAISEEEHEVTLSEERPVVEKEAVPVERVRLSKDQEATEQTVSDEVRKERIEAEGDVADDRRNL
ncbi:MAG: PRC and DUF2382 domain-containing protein [Actinomycetota bacterium]|nr:PRC and DUF2382 domain-containing protein [Actinomycetota bacterium]